MNPSERSIADKLAGAKHVAVLTGAGISAESGVPTFRDAGGLWRNYRPEELATPEAFGRNPNLVWEWYNWRRRMLSDKRPNAGHIALAELERLLPDVVLITQNVDGLHREAGSRNPLELHGNIMRNRCIECGEVTPATVQEEPELLRCHCGGLLRPDVVWFGESLREAVLEQAFRASEKAEVFLCVGTSALVYPAAALPLVAKRNGGIVVEINPEETPLSEKADVVLRGNAGDILPRLVRAVAAKGASHSSARSSVETP
jgi:NAD-dependent deacetylase